MNDRPPLPPFTRETAAQKVQAAEDAWNTRDPGAGALAYTEDSVWRNRDTFLKAAPRSWSSSPQKWERELDYSLRKNLWAFDENRIAVRFQYECHDRDGQWWRSYGNELWEFDERGLMMRREASINDVRSTRRERRIRGPRPKRARRAASRALRARIASRSPRSSAWRSTVFVRRGSSWIGSARHE